MRELLQHYQDLTAKLENRLVEALESPTRPPIEGAMWTLEDTIQGFVGSAQRERRLAKERVASTLW